MQTDVIAQFDRAMDLYMSARFGGDNAWRVACHRAAKIAAAALAEIVPSVPIKAVLVELLAYMDGGTSFVHIGWRNDPEQIPGSIPMHWAVQIGDDLYDPCFWQLSTKKTPLRLPREPYFFAPDWFARARSGRATDAEGVTWCVDSGSPGLNIGYLVRGDELPSRVRAQLMSRDTVRVHAGLVRAAYAATMVAA
ncbi:hypothetical protein ACFPOU_07745 [Massilia jejuensis]|uniref:Uncharacterized protein n=1 Tax=Massilia jejuensis TaxID=648894 RepID=A0ABW0PG53_9BURK